MALCSCRLQRTLAVLCAFTLPLQLSYGWEQTPPPAGQNQTFPPDQLDSLVAPIALYPDPLLSQILVASTYPLEIVEADRWLKQNANLKGKDLAAAATKQNWDASVQALVTFPDVLNELNKNISWTTDLGNAFLAQESDVMQAVQRMRQKAQQSGALQSNAQQKVTTTSENNANYIVIQPANPEVVYVPTYDPYAIWGAPVYPYPPAWYPGVAALTFGAGFAVGAIWGGGWGWGCGWGHGNVTVNNNFLRVNNFNRTSFANNNVWQHNAMHRQGVPYSNRNVANRYNNGGNLNPANRPNANQVQQKLGQANRQTGTGNIGQSGRGAAPAGQRNTGTANRSTGQGVNPGNQGQRFGGANRQMGGASPGANRGAFGGGNRAPMNMNRGFGGGGMRGGGGGRRR